jgi:serine/threonine protein kinase
MVAGKFSRYEIRGELGKGGMAEVYRAYDPRFDREVALKIMRREMLQDQKLRERFERETRILASLELEGIVPVYDVGQSDDGQLFYVMRLMTGGTLADQMQNGPLSTSTILRVLQRIAPVLDMAHENGIIHRDLKPGNILFDKQGHAYIADFGIAKSIRVIAPDTTASSSGILGTPRYMSPEQGRGESVDGRSDIYSLGVIIFEMLVGKTNFDSVVTPLGLAFTQETNVIHRVLDTNPSLPPGVQAVIEKVLARDRDLRYATCMEFVTDLLNALSKPVVPPDEPVQPLSSRPIFWAAVGIIILSILIVGILISIPKYQPVPPSQTVTATVIPSRTVPPPTATSLSTRTVASPTTAAIDPGIGGANKVAFTANDEIYLMNIDGSGIESVTNTGIPKYDLQWLPGDSELLYIESNCVYRINADMSQKDPEKVLCLNDPDFTGFRVSQDGNRVAISIAGRLLVLPFDLDTLAKASSSFELQKLEDVCMNYTDVAVKDALWSNDGKRLAIRYQSVVNDRIGDTIRVIQGNWERCQEGQVFTWDEFPADRFVPDGYARYPILPSYTWDGDQKILVNSFIRNKSYGDLYSYDMSSKLARKINPVDGACCYGAAVYSPDGSYVLLAFQDQRKAPDNETALYYIPVNQIGTGVEMTPLPVPSSLFQDWRENIQLALRSSRPAR